MEAKIHHRFVGRNIYCDTPALLFGLKHSIPAAQQPTTAAQVAKALSILKTKLMEDPSYGPSLGQHPEAPLRSLGNCHLWLIKVIADLVDEPPALARLMDEKDDHYLYLVLFCQEFVCFLPKNCQKSPKALLAKDSRI